MTRKILHPKNYLRQHQYGTERLQARIYLIIYTTLYYTILFSSPLLSIVLYTSINRITIPLNNRKCIVEQIDLSNYIIIIIYIYIIFLVKAQVFFLDFWLPQSSRASPLAGRTIFGTIIIKNRRLWHHSIF